MRIREQGIKLERVDPIGEKIWSDTALGRSNIYPISYGPYLPSYKYCEDEIHPQYPKEGGPLDIRGLDVSFNDASGWTGRKDYYSGTRTRIDIYEGVFRCMPEVQFSTPNSGLSACASYGADAWNRFRPAKPNVSLFAFAYELKSIRDLIFKRLNSFRSLGSNYLAVEFGWKPTLRDIQSWYQSLRQIDRRIAQLQRDNGRWIRRSGTFLIDEDQEIFSSTLAYIVPTYGLSDFHYRRVSTTKEKVWFSGAFRYYIPGLMSQKWGRLKAIDQLWDLSLSPSQVWALLPFSWLVDWFTNISSVIGNLQAAIDDHLVAKYAYVMRQSDTIHEITTAAKGSQTIDGQTTYVNYQPKLQIHEYTKSRSVANPFGFSSSFSGLSTWQTSILTALSLSKGKF